MDNATKALEFIGVLLERAAARNAKWPEGVQVSAPENTGDEILVDLDGVNVAVKVEVF